MNILQSTLRNNQRVLNHIPLIKYKIQSKTPKLGLIEFHPTDNCNLKCTYCTYANSKNTNNHFPFDKLDNILKLEPKGIVFAGGGEPTTYKDGKKNFNDLIKYLSLKSPNLELGLITNGVRFPKGDWFNKLSWIRLSIDYHDPYRFNKVKGGNLNLVFNNLLRYLKSSIKHVGVGFLVNKNTISSTNKFIKKIYDFVINNLGEEYVKKLNIQIRYSCKIESCNCPSKNYEKLKNLTPNLSSSWQKKVLKERRVFDKLNDRKFITFLKSNTNLFEFDNMPKPKEFDKCYLSLIRGIIRADGTIYPCVIKASNKEDLIGNIILNDLKTIEERQSLIYNLKTCKGQKSCCIFDRNKNYLIEQSLTNNNPPINLIYSPFF